MSATTFRVESDRLSAEHRGLARHFMDRMSAATVAAIPLMQAVADDAFETLQRRHKAALRSINRVQDIKRAEKVGLRPEFLTTIETRYRQIPAMGCVGISIKRQDRYSIAIRDVRIAAPRWEGGTELGAVLIANTIDITRCGIRGPAAAPSAN